jgi:hypothetical protein
LTETRPSSGASHLMNFGDIPVSLSWFEANEGEAHVSILPWIPPSLPILLLNGEFTEWVWAHLPFGTLRVIMEGGNFNPLAKR